jgi:glyoxylase-like metal-dependent hydrolase (beta-lactamase superfamily II)
MRVLARADVRQIALTHSHEDNIGGLALLRQRFPDAVVYAARQALPILADPAQLHLQAYRRLLWGQPQGVQAVLSLDEVDDRIRTPAFTLRAVETPGHSRDHVCYFEPRHRWLFTGDSFIGGRDIAWPPEFDMFAIISSLRTLASLRPERVFPSSGAVRRTPLADLHGKISALIQLANQVKALDANGYTTDDIVQMLFRGEPRLRWWTRSHFSAANLVAACRTYNMIVEPAAEPLPAATRSGRRTASS